MVSRIPAPLLTGINKLVGSQLKTRYKPLLKKNLEILAGPIMSPEGKIQPEFLNPFARQFFTVFELPPGEKEENIGSFMQEIQAENLAGPGEGKESVSREIYNALVLLEMNEKRFETAASYGEKEKRLREAIHDIQKIGLTEKERDEALIRCVVEGLKYGSVRRYEVDLASGSWKELLTYGAVIGSRFKAAAGKPADNEEKSFLSRILKKELSEQHLADDIKRGLYTLARNGQWLIFYVPKRSACYFVDQERINTDRQAYPQGDVEEVMFLVLGDPKNKKMAIYQMSNWGAPNQPLVREWKEDIRLLQTFAESLVLAEDNRVLHEKVQNLSRTDALTGLWNRRYFDEKLLNELKMAVRLNYPLSLLMIDIDHFKKINDTYGHQFGDKVLCKVTKKIQEHVRDTDTAARYGGEEFIVILPGADGKGGGEGEDACQVAERIRKSVEELVFPFGDEEVKVTISIGVTYAYPEEIGDILDGTAEGKEDLFLPLIEQADSALYAAKRGGRNRILLFAPELPPAK